MALDVWPVPWLGDDIANMIGTDPLRDLHVCGEKDDLSIHQPGGVNKGLESRLVQIASVVGKDIVHSVVIWFKATCFRTDQIFNSGELVTGGLVGFAVGVQDTEDVDLVRLVRVARVTIGHVPAARHARDKFGLDGDLNGLIVDFDLSDDSKGSHRRLLTEFLKVVSWSSAKVQMTCLYWPDRMERLARVSACSSV